MSVNPQYTYDDQGNPLGVFLSISDWNRLVDELHIEVPDWQKKLLDLRLQEYESNPSSMQEVDSFLEELDREDAK